MPAVTVVIPTHDRRHELAEALACLVAQEWHDWEAIIVDDRSEEDIAGLVAEMNDERLRYVRLDSGRQGAPAARNVGTTVGRGDFVLFLDSDDLLSPSCLSRRVPFLRERPELDFAVWACGQFRRRAGDSSLRWNELITAEPDLIRFLKKDVVWQTSSPLWRREALAKIGPWDEGCLSGQDWEFHTRALLAGLHYEKVDEVDHYWRAPDPTRRTIGNMAWRNRQHALAWRTTFEHVLATAERHGRINDQTRPLLAGTAWHVASKIAEEADRAEGRAVWKLALDHRLISRGTFLSGQRHLYLSRFERARDGSAQRLARRMPEVFGSRVSRTFLKYRPADATPAVSVVMAAYNAEAFVAEALKSVCDQSLRDLEILVIDDGSTDRTLPIVQEIAAKDARVRIITRENRGLVASLNEGITLARAPLIARMDADDIALHDRLRRQIDFLDAHPDVVLLGGQCQDVDPFGLPLIFYPLPTEHEAIDAALLVGNGGALRHPAVVMRKAAVEQVGGYRERCVWAEDLDLFLRLAEMGRVANLDGEPILYYRQHPASVNRTRGEIQRRSIETGVRDAYARRGMPFPPDWRPDVPPLPPAAQQLRAWGWRALRAGKLDAARGHARKVLSLEPFSLEAWRLMYCAVRGR